jgi:DNA-binding transcriptional MerR regulator
MPAKPSAAKESSGTKTYTIKELAQLIDVSTATLRAWERRYGIMAPDRTTGGHRIYDESDLRIFLYVCHLRTLGKSLIDIGKTSRVALEAAAKSHFETISQTNSESAYESAVTDEILSCLSERRLDDAIGALERAAVTATSATEFANLSLSIMQQVGKAWTQGQVSMSIEHLFTARIRFLLAEQFYRSRNALHTSSSWERTTSRSRDASVQESQRPAKTPKGPIHAVVAGLAGEVHEIGILRVSIFLQSWGSRVSYLGPDLPAVELCRFVDDIKSSSPPETTLVVCAGISSAHSPEVVASQAQQLVDLIARRHLTVMGGSGVSHLQGKETDFEPLVITQCLDVLRGLIIQF